MTVFVVVVVVVAGIEDRKVLKRLGRALTCSMILKIVTDSVRI